MDAISASNIPELTVSEISSAIRRSLEGSFSHIRVRGEVGRVTRHRSGHIYFDLKDDKSSLSAVIWKGKAIQADYLPDEGAEIVAIGKISAFAGQSRYQIIVETIEPAGIGALMAKLEKRKKLLAAEGLFAQERKRPLPVMARCIGVITSPTGAVIRDILHRLRERFPSRVLLWPVAVQGKNCAAEVAQALRGFTNLSSDIGVVQPDLIIVARGGGSLEDLWGFNEEIVVRAIAESSIPVISAIGHETDYTLADLAADLRAPTPTAAAEMAVPVRTELVRRIAGLEERRQGGLTRRMRLERERLRALTHALPKKSALTAEARQRLDFLSGSLAPVLHRQFERKSARFAASARAWPKKNTLTAEARQRLDFLGGALAPALDQQFERKSARFAASSERLSPFLIRVSLKLHAGKLEEMRARLQRFGDGLDRQRARLEELGRLLRNLGYRSVLDRGFALVKDGQGKLVSTARSASQQARLTIEFSDGDVEATPLKKL